MHLENRGLIFDIRRFEPFANYSYAQSPQLLCLGSVNRVYFSSRPRSRSGGLPTSDALFVDFDLNFRTIIDYSRRPVVEPSILGAFDEHGIFPFHVARINDRLLGYISGWSRRKSVPVETAIGISESFDNGLTFQRLGTGPILAASLFEPFLVGDPFVVPTRNSFLMFYIAGESWKKTANEVELQRVYKIRMAESVDGVDWKPCLRNIIENVIDEDECQALPSVIAEGNQMSMVFCFRPASMFRQNGSNAYRLGFASSDDGYLWQRNDEFLSIDSHPTGWDSGMRCYPNLSKVDGKTVLLYNGNDFGRDGFGMAVEI